MALARFAAKHDLHLVSDEIYARSCFRTRAVPDPPQFHSVLSMDLQKEAGLPLSKLHVVTSASKDFSINVGEARQECTLALTHCLCRASVWAFSSHRATLRPSRR